MMTGSNTLRLARNMPPGTGSCSVRNIAAIHSPKHFAVGALDAEPDVAVGHLVFAVSLSPFVFVDRFST